MRHYKFIDLRKSKDLVVSTENNRLHKACEFGYDLLMGLTINNRTVLTLTYDDIKYLRKVLRRVKHLK